MKLFGTFEKVEEQTDGTLKVYGHASSEAEDAQGEIVKASAMEKAMPDYLKFGAVREMHSNIAAGTAIEMAVEADGRTSFGAHVVDPIAVKKVQTKVYKGFSIGGTVLERDSANKKIITGLKLTEISLVDRPANPDATFSLFKAEGVVAPDTDTPDPAAAKVEEPTPVADATGEPAEVKKSMYGVASLASLLSSAATETMIAQWEADAEQDSSPVPAALRAWLADGLKILNAMAAEESAELMASVTPKEPVVVEVVELADAKGDLAKAGARHSASDQKHVQSMHDSAVALGAGCGAGEKAAPAGDLAKVFPVNLSELGKAVAIATGSAPAEGVVTAEQIESLGKFAIAIAGERDELKKKVEKLEAEPAPAKGVQKVVGKEDDSVVVEKKEDEIDPKDSLALMKKAHANPKLIKL